MPTSTMRSRPIRRPRSSRLVHLGSISMPRRAPRSNSASRRARGRSRSRSATRSSVRPTSPLPMRPGSGCLPSIPRRSSPRSPNMRPVRRVYVRLIWSRIRAPTGLSAASSDARRDGPGLLEPRPRCRADAGGAVVPRGLPDASAEMWAPALDQVARVWATRRRAASACLCSISAAGFPPSTTRTSRRPRSMRAGHGPCAASGSAIFPASWPSRAAAWSPRPASSSPR